jgi:hypothetical protein
MRYWLVEAGVTIAAMGVDLDIWEAAGLLLG